MKATFRQGPQVESKPITPVCIRRNGTGPVLSSFLLALALTFSPRIAPAQGQMTVNLGAAAGFAVLAGSTVTSTGETTVKGDLGVSPGTAVTGFPPGTVVNGMIHAGDATAATAETALTLAYNDVASRSLNPVPVTGDLGGMTLTPGLYRSPSSLAISSGDLILDAQGNADAVFIFQMGSTLITSSDLQVILQGGANADNIFWQVGSSATLGTGSIFHGNILASESITLTTGATLFGRALASNGAVTLDSNLVVIPVAVPEPGTVMLFALGFGLIARRRAMNRAA